MTRLIPVIAVIYPNFLRLPHPSVKYSTLPFLPSLSPLFSRLLLLSSLFLLFFSPFHSLRFVLLCFVIDAVVDVVSLSPTSTTGCDLSIRLSFPRRPIPYGRALRA